MINAPACFQRFMEQCLNGYQDDFVIPYLDDLLIFSSSFDEHVQHLKLVFQRLKKFGIKIKASKCKLFRREISYLGRLISSGDYTADPKNVSVVSSKINKKPETISELRTLLGLVGYFRRYTPNFSKTESPLYQLLKDQPEKSCKTPIEREKKQ